MTEVRSSRVYVIGDPSSNGPVKLGTTTNLPVRLRTLRSGRGAIIPAQVNAAALEVLYDHPGDRRFEAGMHSLWAPFRLAGEWFALSPETAFDHVMIYLFGLGMSERLQDRGTTCSCFECTCEHPAEQHPGDRLELVNPSRELLAAINAITHARLGVNLSDDHVGLAASHCDIDRATRLLEVLGSR